MIEHKCTRSAAPTEIDFVIEARRNVGAGPAAIAGELAITPAAVNARLEKMKRYREGERLLAEDPESLEGLKYVGAISWAVARGVGEYYVERLSQLADWSAVELQMRCPGVGPKAVETVQTLLATRGLALHPERSEPVERRSRYQDWWERTGRAALSVSAPPAAPKPSPVTARDGNILHVDFRHPAPE